MKLLIVDDELQICYGLKDGIEWDKLGITAVFTASNGLEALDICRKKRPELIITDIRMPGISGIELGKQVLELYEPVRIIVLSGYSEFSYAQEAIKIGVSDYLLKPIDTDELCQKVALCRDSVLKEQETQKKQHAYTREQQRKEIQTYVSSPEPLSPSQTEALSAYTGVSEKSDCIIAQISIDHFHCEVRQKVLDYLSTQLSQLASSRATVLFQEADSIFVLLPAEAAATRITAVRSWQKKINAILDNQFSESISVSLSDAGPLHSTNMLCRQARAAMKHRLYLGTASFIPWQSVKDVSGNEKYVQIHRAKLEEYMMQLRFDLVEESLTELFSTLRSMKVATSAPYVMVCMEFKSLALSSMHKRGIMESDLIDSEDQKEQIPEFATAEEYEAWAKALNQRIRNHVGLMTDRKCSKEIMRAADYIRKNYAQTLTLNGVAEYIHKSRNYFSYLFRQEMGIGFVDYVNKIRVREACRLLDTTDALSYEIASEVGFDNYKYFSSVFKKIMGCSPDKYRRRSNVHKTET